MQKFWFSFLFLLSSAAPTPAQENPAQETSAQESSPAKNVERNASGRTASAEAQRIREQIPDLDELPDRTDELQQQLNQTGNLVLTEKRYRITRTITLDLAETQSAAIRSETRTTIVMDGPGPAFRLIGSHQGTASPKSFQPGTWNESMPIISDIEIVGAHPDADGVELDRTVGVVMNRCTVRWCRHGAHLVRRNRNVIISDCHFYENSGIGVFLDDVNLHQINVVGSHISYNRQGGVVVRDGNVRNLHVTGCDIEANMPGDETETNTANVLIDVSQSPEDASKSIAEISITGCTIQHSANYSGSEEKTTAPGGANIRLAGKAIYPIDSVTISGNVLSDTTTSIDIRHAYDVAISANNFFAPKPNNLRVVDSQRVVVDGNTFNPRQFIRPGTIRFENSKDCVLADSTMHEFAGEEGAIILQRCSGFLLSGLRLTDCQAGIVLKETSDTSIIGCRLSGTKGDRPAIDIGDDCRAIVQFGNASKSRQEEDD